MVVVSSLNLVKRGEKGRRGDGDHKGRHYYDTFWRQGASYPVIIVVATLVVAISPSGYLAISPSGYLAIWLSRHLVISPSRHLPSLTPREDHF
ncbi:MAG TPA: hypothetical protein VNG51_07245 [Ktedonobacteraceae bacterium]|nr:hypothetical protein [Ktedonobacteraceae bacterium]